MPIWAINHIEFTGAESKTDWNILCYDWLRFFGWFLWEFRRSWVVYTVHHSTIINQLQFLKDHLYTSHSAKYVPAPSVTLSLNNDLSVCFWGKRAAMSSLYTLWESSMARWKIPWKSYENPMIFPVKAPCDTYRGYSQLAMLTATGIPKMVLEITCFTMFYLNHLYINGYFPYLHLPKGNHWTMRRTREEPEEPIWVGRSAYPPHPLCTFSRRRSLVPRPETRWSCRCHWCHSSGAPSCVKHVAYGLMDEWNHPSPVACFRQKMRIFVLSDANVIPKYWVLLELIRFGKGFWEHGCDNVVTYVLDFSDVREDPSPFCWNISPSLTCRNSLVVDTLLRGQILSGWWLEHFLFSIYNIWDVILPSDFHIFQRGRSTTNQLQPVITWNSSCLWCEWRWQRDEERSLWAAVHVFPLPGMMRPKRLFFCTRTSCNHRLNFFGGTHFS